MSHDHPADGARLDFKGAMSYGDYLRLDEILGAQHPRSADHNEMLFIVQHQASELWMKLMIHELLAAREQVRRDDLPPAFKMLARVSRIMGQLIQAWDVLSTLTASEYMEFRHKLGHSSGFQSFQYREIEFLLGNKHRELIEPHRHVPAIHARLTAALEAPSLYDEFLGLLARAGYAIPAGVLERDVTQSWTYAPELVPVFTEIYRDPEAHWAAYETCEELVDLEDNFQLWRFRHLKTVERIIGFKTGTGGSSGVAFLRKALELTFFPELWDVRTDLKRPGT